MKPAFLILAGLIAIFAISCNKDTGNTQRKLCIIGGGPKPAEMLQLMIRESGIDKGGYGVVLPMASIQPDTEVLETTTEFLSQGCSTMYGLFVEKGKPVPAEKLDSIRNAKLIFISGGDQARFMNAIEGTGVEEAIHEASRKGVLISGTSAGAAVMSRKMITGNEHKYPGDSSNFNTIEAGNVEVLTGLGMLTTVIIDQHFLIRKRLNRLISVSIENPDEICAGIDESTALFVKGNTATVVGSRQVVVLRNVKKQKREVNGFLGTQGIQLDVLLPGESFDVNE
ncbi:MAG: cyanophycinase [Bacteroidales bacterium]